MKISVITWDASFRESFHTVDSFCRQKYSTEDFEFIWVDFYNNQNPTLLDKINSYSNARLLNLKNPISQAWHLGKCLNAGVRESKGNLLIIPDGDVIVADDFLQKIEEAHGNRQNQVIYCRRWDEPAKDHDSVMSYSYDYLNEVCQLNNPTNYAGMISLHRDTLGFVNGYEESAVFSGPGANGWEHYIRLRNAGCSIQWYSEKVFHPHHSFTGTSDKMQEVLKQAKVSHPWIQPYAGLKQSWVIRQRESDLSYKADVEQIEEYLTKLPDLESLLGRKPSRLGKIKKAIAKL
ncbi:glycosyltransferase family A protein [Tunicatimonas pelagia]|uniref:glycosyltransferase family A protein n=1 Tax=Tunicatimonas pelagia TaxID=931531 RepID=UPI002666F259|nr:glycosyltransferase family A protein [Tunicatimonas pelagia]WKN44451.1 glycosyltransferase family A protein [Tunicatimonas pelagia]